MVNAKMAKVIIIKVNSKYIANGSFMRKLKSRKDTAIAVKA
jgi:hypothetical protein